MTKVSTLLLNGEILNSESSEYILSLMEKEDELFDMYLPEDLDENISEDEGGGDGGKNIGETGGGNSGDGKSSKNGGGGGGGSGISGIFGKVKQSIWKNTKKKKWELIITCSVK